MSETMPKFETARLILRPFVPNDAPAFLKMISDPQVTRYTGEVYDSEMSLDQALELMLIAPIGDYEKYGFGRHAVIDKTTNEAIGFTGLKYLEDLNKVDIGYRLLPEYWGRGLATESCLPMLAYGFETLNLNSIIGVAMPKNVASCRVLEKIGLNFIDERNYDQFNVAYFELFKEQYFADKQGNQV